MPNRKTHDFYGGIAGFAVGSLFNLIIQLSKIKNNKQKKFDWGDFLMYGFSGGALGTIASRLPDKIEPARHPNHRGFFHSYTTAGLITFGLFNISKRNSKFRTIFYTIGAGYLSHILLDIYLSKKGVPLI